LCVNCINRAYIGYPNPDSLEVIDRSLSIVEIG
jgi:ABC-type enterochelin transport system substrate-binding protein